MPASLKTYEAVAEGFKIEFLTTIKANEILRAQDAEPAAAAAIALNMAEAKGVERAARIVAMAFAAENPRFDAARFLAACGVSPTV